jgi:hypothetical protein
LRRITAQPTPQKRRAATAILHSFGNGKDGSEPVTGVTEVKGVLYGTTLGGGKYNDGIALALTL